MLRSRPAIPIEYQRVQKWDGRMLHYQGGEASVLLPGPAASPVPTR